MSAMCMAMEQCVECEIHDVDVLTSLGPALVASISVVWSRSFSSSPSTARGGSASSRLSFFVDAASSSWSTRSMTA
ncbi:hypothetical protein P692DRAFT_20834224, partial [Suillus brevipes Sb2]